MKMINPFRPSVTFDTETSHLICNANQITGFYMGCNTGMKWVKVPSRASQHFLKNNFQLLFTFSKCTKAAPEQCVKSVRG